MYEALKQSGIIGRLSIENRVVMPAMGVNLAGPHGDVSDDIIAFYEARARGGVGLIITEVTRIDGGAGISDPCQLSAYRLSDVAGLSRLAEAVHAWGTKIFIQLQHPGASASPLITGSEAVAPSAGFSPGGTPVRALSLEECAKIEQKFITSAQFSQMAGADGVELHAAHGYLINNFLSPAMNDRSDAYGGNFENRMRFLLNIVAGIRKRCGDFPISVRINATEMLPGGIDLPQAVEMAKALERAGVDAINVSRYDEGCIEPGTWPQGAKRNLTQNIMEAVTIPVIGVSNIKEPAVAEALLSEGICDFVGIGRGLLADPHWVRKTLNGQEDIIRKCIGCLTCFEEIVSLRRVACAVNPLCGRERFFNHPSRVKSAGKHVAVIGGGPAGIEAALVLKRRGFDVHLFDDQKILGGTLNVADKGYGKEKITRYTESLVAQVTQAGIILHRAHPATPQAIRGLAPCGIFIACGARPLIPDIPGIDDPRVVCAEAILTGKKTVAGQVVVVGTGMTGLETAEVLAMVGCTLTLVEMLPAPGPGVYPSVVKDVLSHIEPHRPKMLLEHKLVAIDQEGVVLRSLKEGVRVHVPAQAIVLALGVRPRLEVAKTFSKAFPDIPVIPVGDALQGGRILEATRSAHGRAFTFTPQGEEV